MASRLYGTDQAAAFQPTPQNASGTPVWRDTSLVKVGSQETRTQNGAGGTYTSNVLWVSPPLAAQTISGTASCAIFWVLLSVAAPYVRIWVSQGATSSVRGTLLAQSASMMNISNPAVENAVSFAGGNSASLSSVAAQAGDRLVIQLDMDGTGQSRHRWGGTGADATANSTTTSQTSWLEFSQTLIWLAPSVRAWICE